MDLSNLTTVRKSYTRTQNYDVRYSNVTGTFQMSDAFYASKNMNNNGMTLHTAEDGTLLISLRPNSESVFAKGKEGQENKGLTFSYSILEKALKEQGVIGDDEKGHVNLKLEKVGSHEGYDYYQVLEWEQEEGEEEVVEQASEEETPELDAEVTAEDEDENQDQDNTPEPEPVAAEEDESEIDPFL